MKTHALLSLLCVAAAGFLVQVNANMCPHEFFKSHPEYNAKKMEIMRKYGLPDFSRLTSCSENQACADGKMCCITPCGMKCIRPINENNPDESLELIKREMYPEGELKPYVETDEDRRLGMCPDNYYKTHPEVQRKMEEFWKNKGKKEHKCGSDCKEGGQCPAKKGGKGKHFQHHADLPACGADGDCQEGKRCCSTMCGKKCMKPVTTDEEYFQSWRGKKNKDKQKRDLTSQGQIQGEDEGAKNGKGHGKGLEHGKGAKNGKGHGKGLEHGKGAQNGKGHGKGLEHGKGAKNGKGHGKGLEHGKGAQNGKGHGKGLEHGKGAQNGNGPEN